MSILIGTASNLHYLQDGVNYQITLAGSLENENIVSFHYSKDDGATWSSALAVSTPTMPIEYSGGPGDDSWTAIVTIPAADYTAIFPTDGGGVRDLVNDQILFKAVGTVTVDGQEIASAITFSLVAGVVIKPDNNNTMTNPNLNDALLSNHDKPFHTSESINVIWDIATGTIDPATPIEIWIEWSDNASYRYMLANNLTWGMGNKVISLKDSSYPGGAFKGYTAKIFIKSATSDAPQIYFVGERFGVTDKEVVAEAAPTSDATNVLPPHSYPQRVELFSRTAVEKAIFMDEAIALSQMEAGKGVRIRQRDHEGKKVNNFGTAGPMADEDGNQYTAENPTDYAKAFNVVVEIDPTTLPTPALPRAMQGIINFNTLSSGVTQVGNINDRDHQYGVLRKYVINHNWNLGDTGDPDYKEYQTANSYHLEFMHIDDTYPNEVTHVGWTRYDAEPVYATLNRNQIEVFCRVKNSAVAGMVALLDKDKVLFDGDADDPVPDYRFEWRLVEVIPRV